MKVRRVQFLQRFLAREDGPTAVEYAVMLALIIVTCISAIGLLGGNASGTFGAAGNSMTKVGNGNLWTNPNGDTYDSVTGEYTFAYGGTANFGPNNPHFMNGGNAFSQGS